MIAQALPGLSFCLASEDLTPEQIRYRLEKHSARLAGMDSPLDLVKTIRLLAPKIVVGADRIQIHVSIETFRKLIEQEVSNVGPGASNRPLPLTVEVEAESVAISSAIQLAARRGRAEIVDGQTGKVVSATATEPNPALIHAIVQAEYWRGELAKHQSRSLNEVLLPYGVQPTYVRRLLNAAYLAPAIKRASSKAHNPRPSRSKTCSSSDH